MVGGGQSAAGDRRIGDREGLRVAGGGRRASGGGRSVAGGSRSMAAGGRRPAGRREARGRRAVLCRES
jgi:hypothetical protein